MFRWRRGSVVTNTTNVKVTDKDSKIISVTKSTDSNGNVKITLPTGKTLDDNNWYTIKTTDRNGKEKADVEDILKAKYKNEAKGTTDKNGALVLPGKEHKAYIVGYPDGTFRPNEPVTRAEFVSMAVRYYGLFSNVKKSNYTVKYTDVSKNYWVYSDIAYAKNKAVLNGENWEK